MPSRNWLRIAAIVLLPGLCVAVEAPAPRIDSGDTAWVLVSAALVLFMTIPGLSLLYAGLVRAKNALSVFTQCFAITALVTVLWVLCGYSLAFGPSAQTEGATGLASFIGGLGRLGLAGLTPTGVHGNAPTIPESVYCCFQLTFAIITPALVISAFVERVRFAAVMLFTAVWLFVVYVPIAHMVWSGPGGFLWGTLDYAGGCAVEINSGVSGLVAALLIGRRKGYPLTPMLPHSVAMCVIGGGMLWVGWFGFNAGSAVSAGASAGMAMLTTQVAAAVATCAWMAIEWIRFGRPSGLGAVTGSLVGLVVITPSCGYVSVGGAVVLALIATAACYLGCTWLKRRFGYDDSLDVFGVHGIAGLVGTLGVGLFGTVAWGGNVDAAPLRQLGSQAIAVFTTVGWAALGTAAAWLVVKLAIGWRVDEAIEHAGVDLAEHGETAYNFEERT
jgi:Amt family ammonium transporter